MAAARKATPDYPYSVYFPTDSGPHIAKHTLNIPTILRTTKMRLLHTSALRVGDLQRLHRFHQRSGHEIAAYQ